MVRRMGSLDARKRLFGRMEMAIMSYENGELEIRNGYFKLAVIF